MEDNLKWIPDDLYYQIVNVMPIPCIDLLVKNKQGKYLLCRRTSEPLKDTWYMPGSRLIKGETISNAVKRISRKELGIRAIFNKVLCVYNAYYDVGYFGIASHTLTVVVEAEPKSERIKLDNSHSEYKWMDNYSSGLHKYVRMAIKRAKGEI